MAKGDKTRRRARRKAKQRAAQAQAPQRATRRSQGSTGASVALCERPTDERMTRGSWHVASKEAPAVDVAADMIGHLRATQKITQAQEQAARTWQELRVAYLAELPEISGYRSCIDPSVPGYDDGDGDAAVIRRYREIERALGQQGRRIVLWVCEHGERPYDLRLLRWALDVVEGC